MPSSTVGAPSPCGTPIALGGAVRGDGVGMQAALFEVPRVDGALGYRGPVAPGIVRITYRQ